MSSLPFPERPRIAIVGSGAMGCYYGARLAAGGCDVHFLMRRDLAHVRHHGLTIRSHLGDFTLPAVQAAGTTAEIGPVDLVIVTLKATANAALDALIPPLLGPQTKLLTLQNGLGNEEYLAERWGAHRVLGGVCFTCINRTAPGLIEHTAQGQVALGAHTPESEAAAATVCATFNACGIETTHAPSIPAVRWRKLVWNVPFNGLAILGGGIDTAQILADPALTSLACDLMGEVIAISHHLGHPLPEDFVEFQLQATRTMAAYRPSSMIDFIEGRDVEVEAIWGEPSRRATAAGAAAPRLDTLYRLIHSATARRGLIPAMQGPLQ
jgi:2-dehydropantoate 2-reductase